MLNSGTSSARESLKIDAHHLLTLGGELDTPPITIPHLNHY